MESGTVMTMLRASSHFNVLNMKHTQFTPRTPEDVSRLKFKTSLQKLVLTTRAPRIQLQNLVEARSIESPVHAIPDGSRQRHIYPMRTSSPPNCLALRRG